MVTLTLDPGGGNERVLDESELSNYSFEKTHTGMGTFEAEIPYEPSIDSRFFDEVHLEDSGEFLFRGFLLAINSDEGRGITRLTGKGIAWELTNDERTVTYTDTLAHNAIQDYWDTYTSFSATVTTPTPNTTVTDQSVQEANTDAEFTSVTTIADDEPLAVQNDNLELLQSADPEDALIDDTANNNYGFVNGDEYNSGQAGLIQASGAFVEFEFTFDYDIPSSRVGIQVRDETNAASDISFKWDGTEFDRNTSGSVPLGWSDIGNGTYDAGGGYDTNIGQQINAGQTYTLRIEANAASDYSPDVVAVYDNQFNYDFPNPDALTNGGGILDGPQEYPDAFTFPFDQVTQSLNITDATINTTWDDTTNNQSIQLRLGSGTWFPNDGTENNTTSVTTDFDTEDGRDITGRATFSRYGTGGGSIPATGFNGQVIQSWEILIDANDLVIFSDKTIEGTDLENLQRLHSLADMRFSIDHAASSKNVDSFQVGDAAKSLPDLDIRNQTRRQDLDKYANHVTVRGQRSGGTRITATEQNASEISQFGQVHKDRVDPTLETQIAVDEEAKAFLDERIREAVLKGELDVSPVDVRPGFTYPNPFDGGADDVPIEEVRYQERVNGIEGRLIFDFRAEQLAEFIGGLRGGQETTKRGF